ncbi:MAG TPA: hypothetical protein VKA21_03735, partial [Candidatus Binatia bacterium]|nr:hypothetical protein [Candidatus Binatia bacterium]
MTTLHTFWRRPTAGCRATLFAGRARVPGTELATAELPDGATGWIATPLDVSLTAGALYRVLLTCEHRHTGRLGYVIDGNRSASRSGAWRLERTRHGRFRRHGRHASPLFALVFDDGRWWGQPYRGGRGRPTVRACGGRQVTATLVPSRPLLVTDLRLPGRRRAHGVGFTIDASDGRTMLTNLAPDGPESLARGRRSAPAMLAAGVRYTLRLRGGGRRHACFRARALVT